MAGYDFNTINALGSDPMFLAALNSYNPNFMAAYANSAQTPQVTQPEQPTSAETLPEVDYSQHKADSSTGLVVGLGAVAAGVATTIYAARKGKGNILEGFKNIFKGAKDAVSKNADKNLKKTGTLKDIRVAMKNGKPVYYISGKTVTTTKPNEIQALLKNNKQLTTQLKSLRYGTGETAISAGTFTLKDNGNANTIIFKGDKIEDIINSSGQSIKDKFLENGKIKSDIADVSDNAFARRIEEYIYKIKQGDKDIIRGKDTNLRDFTYTTQIGDTKAEVFRQSLPKGGNAEIRSLTTLKEFDSNSDEVLAYVRSSRENGANIDAIVGEDFLKKGKLPDGYKVQEFTLTDRGNIIKVVDGKVDGVTIAGKFYDKNTDKCKAYLERNQKGENINKMIEKALKDNNIPRGATIVPV